MNRGGMEMSGTAAANEIVIENKFGKVVVDAGRPRITGLWPRNPDGSLSKDSILSKLVNGFICGRAHGTWRSDSIAFANGAYSYVIGTCTPSTCWEARRYESTLSQGHQVNLSKDERGQVIKVEMTGIELVSPDDPDAPVVEDWTICASEDGSELVWGIRQQWRRDAEVWLSGTPALFLGPFGGWRDRNLAGKGSHNCVTSTLWYEPARLKGSSYGPPYLCEAGIDAMLAPVDVCQTISERDTWAVYKLFSNLHLKCDVRLCVSGGYLYRRGGHWGSFNELGTTIADDQDYSRKAGAGEHVELRLAAVDKFSTGYQLDIDFPDKELEGSLKDMYASVLNGGAIAYQKEYYFGNQSEGCSHDGAAWIFGFPVSVGIPAVGQVAEYPYDPGEAFRGLLQGILDTVGENDTTNFSLMRYVREYYKWECNARNLDVLISVRPYYLQTGDILFIEKNLPVMERLLQKVADHIDRENGLYLNPQKSASWYYELEIEGYSTYNNIMLYRALSDMAEMERLVGHAERSLSYGKMADRLKAAINRILWMEDAPGGARYSDWTTLEGKQVSYFADIVQYPAIVYGVAAKEQAQKIIATADRRMAELERDFGFAGHASPSFLWDNGHGRFGIYTNGGTLLWITYFEVVARCLAGDSRGAYKRLKGFCRGYDRHSWVGDNAANIRGEMYHKSRKECTGDGEPYLADFVAVTAAAVNGIMGIVPGWDRLDVSPCLPEGWTEAAASIMYKGVEHRVTIGGNQVDIRPVAAGCRR